MIQQVEQRIKRQVLPLSPEEKARFAQLSQAADAGEQAFFALLMETLEQFEQRAVDTTLLTIGNIDGQGPPDTITSTVTVEQGKVLFHSRWVRQGEVLWEEDLPDPYMALNESEVFDYEQRSPWVTLTTALH